MVKFKALNRLKLTEIVAKEVVDPGGTWDNTILSTLFPHKRPL